MNAEIGILALDQLVNQGEGEGIFKELRESIPPSVEVLEYPSSAFGILDFIEKHKHLIIWDRDSSTYGRGTTLGEVEYWGQLTGGMPEEIVVLGGESVQESIVPILEYINRWESAEKLS